MADSDSVAELMARCVLRDERAFAQLYRHTAGKLFAVALRILRRQDWAEEVLQESFVNIWNHVNEYAAQKSAPMTWMTAIVRNRALDWLRRPNMERGGEDYDLLVEAVADEAPGPEVQLGSSRATLGQSAAEHRTCVCTRLVARRTGHAHARAAGNCEDLDPARARETARMPTGCSHQDPSE
jgi:RNA polymerase sigma factor (sigma-70 family)